MATAFAGPGGLPTTTSYKVVLPFYGYAAMSFLIASLLLFFHTQLVFENHFYPFTLAITHTMALGWGTMIILGASHQLLPVLVEGKLSSNSLAYLTFIFCAIGIPFLILGFYNFDFGGLLQTGAILINLGILFYATNVFISIFKSKKHEIHTWFMAAATIWLFSTTFLGLLLVFNFEYPFLPADSVSYLSIHAHLGIVGWFLMLITGVASRLIPLFLISKYHNNKTLWKIFFLINAGLLSFIVFRLLHWAVQWYYLSILMILCGVLFLGDYCRRAYKVRIRKNVDNQVKTSLMSILQMVIPIIALVVVLLLLPSGKETQLPVLYGFCVFFGWITAIILGMTFKTLPFISWNRVYSKRAHGGKTPAPKELFNKKIFIGMMLFYILGFLIFLLGMVIEDSLLLKIGAVLLVITAILYTYNSFITLFHQPQET